MSYRLIIAVVAIVGSIFLIYHEGKSFGYSNGYNEAEQVYSTKLADVEDKYNRLVATSNKKINELEAKASELSKQKSEIIAEYQKRIDAIIVKDTSKAWSTDTVKKINEVIK